VDYGYEDYEEDRYREVNEYLTEIDKIVRGEVVKKYGELLERIDHLTNEASRLKKLCGKCQMAQRDFDVRVREAAKKLNEEFWLKYFGPYRVSQKVWIVSGEWVREKCKTCNRSNKAEVCINGNRETMKCPKCEGRGEHSHFESKPRKSEIKRVYGGVDWHGTHFSYGVDGRDSVKNDEIFTTEAECAAACNALNEKRKNQ
jgi:hypothetical protein